MPMSEDAEKAVLGCILKMPTKLDDARDIFTPEWFYIPSHRKIYETMIRIDESKKVVDLLTLIARLESEGHLDEVGGRAEVAGLLDDVPTASFFDHYADILKNNFQLRKIILEATNIVRSAYEAPENVQELADTAAETMGRVADCVQGHQAMPSMRERVLDAVDRYQGAHDRGDLMGISTGLSKLDKMTGGFLDSNLSIIAGRPSFGKTAMMTQVCGHIAIENKIETGIFSGEMDGDSLTDRFFSQMAEVNLHDLNGGAFDKHDFDRLMRQAKAIAASNLYIDDRAGLTISEIRRAGRRMKQKQGVKIIFLDFLQRFRADTARENADERARYAAVSGGLKDMSKELKIPVVCLAQLGRSADSKLAIDIKMSDLEGCSKIEQDADFIGFLGMPVDDSNEDKIFEDVDFIIAKQRNGPRGPIQLRFRKAHTLFTERTTIV